MTPLSPATFAVVDSSDVEPIFKVMGVYSCDHCRQQVLAYTYLVGHQRVDAMAAMEANKGELIWIPNRGSRPPEFRDVPKAIAEAGQEVYRCRSINAHRSAVIMARSVIEASAKARGVTKGTLFEKIDAMYAERMIREDVRDGAHEVRHFGNDMAHGDFVDPVTDEESEQVIVLMTEVLTELFEAPARVKRVSDARLAKTQALAITGP